MPRNNSGGRKVFAINPMAAARYRDRHGVSRKKSDPGDALVLANILRTDMPVHRPMPADTDLARAIAVLARAQQDATWNRQQISNQLRSLLREYYPAVRWLCVSGGQGVSGPQDDPRRPAFGATGFRPHALLRNGCPLCRPRPGPHISRTGLTRCAPDQLCIWTTLL